jgi:hypothetical protein
LKKLKSDENGATLDLTISGNLPSKTNLFEFAYNVVENIFEKQDLKNGYFTPASNAKGIKNKLDSKILKSNYSF